MTTRPTQSYVIPTGESQVTLKPSAAAWVIDGYEPESDGSLRTLHGMCPWDPHAATASPIYSLFRADLQGRDFLLGHMGPSIVRHKGWYRTWDAIASAAMASAPIYREQYVTVGGRIIWTDGCGSNSVLLDIHADELVCQLGFSLSPATPSVDGPTTSSASDRNLNLPNSSGYSVPGRVGTVGDELSETSAKLLAGSWSYSAQWESVSGDLSPASPMSPTVELSTQWTDPTAYAYGAPAYTQADIDDLLRSFVVSVSGDGAPEHVVAVHVYRTPDLRNDPRGNTPLFLARIPGSSRVLLPDDRSDSELGPPMRRIIPVPPARILCAHQGRLVVANTPDAEDSVYLSEPGFPGTFTSDSWAQIPGGKVTGLASYLGRLIAWSPTGTYEVTEMGLVQPITLSAGCVSPTSVQVTSWGLVWLGQGGVYLMGPDGNVSPISDPISEVLEFTVNRNLFRLAMSASTPGGYRLVLASAGSTRFDVMLTYHPDTGWRRNSISRFASISRTAPEITAMTCGPDGVLILGIRYWVPGGGGPTETHTVMVWDHQMYDKTWSCSTQYISSWLYADEHALTTVRPRKLYVRLVDSSDSSLSVSFQRDGVETTAGATQPLMLTSPLFETQGYEHLGAVVVGADKARRDAPFWRYVAVPPEVSSVRCFRFVLDGAVGQDIRLAGFAFDAEVVSGDAYGRIPGGTE